MWTCNSNQVLDQRRTSPTPEDVARSGLDPGSLRTLPQRKTASPSRKEVSTSYARLSSQTQAIDDELIMLAKRDEFETVLRDEVYFKQLSTWLTNW
jgi:hypothetical protein